MPFQKICANEKCKKEFVAPMSNRKYCSQPCAWLCHRKYERPSAEEMKSLMKGRTWVEVGKILKVSGTTAQRWADAYGFETQKPYPEKEELVDKRRDMTTSEIAKHYEVSVSTVNSWIKGYGLRNKRKGVKA